MRASSRRGSRSQSGAIGVLTMPIAARAQDWPEFRGPGGQGHSAERGVPLEWSETQNIAWKIAGSRARLVVAGRQRRTHLADDGGRRARRLAARPGVRRRDRPRSRQRRSVPDALARGPASQEQLRVAVGRRRRRPRLRALRRRRHGGAHDRRRGRLEDAVRLPVAARRRRIARAPRRSADLQLRWQRRRVRRGARQAHRQDALEDVTAPAVGSGVHDAARHPGRRSRSAGQRRRVSRRGLRSTNRQGNLARQLRRRLLERAAAGLRPRAGLHRHGIPPAGDPGRAARRHRAT